MGLASYCFTKNIDRMWRLFENLEAGMIGMNTGKYPLATCAISWRCPSTLIGGI